MQITATDKCTELRVLSHSAMQLQKTDKRLKEAKFHPVCHVMYRYIISQIPRHASHWDGSAQGLNNLDTVVLISNFSRFVKSTQLYENPNYTPLTVFLCKTINDDKIVQEVKGKRKIDEILERALGTVGSTLFSHWCDTADFKMIRDITLLQSTARS